jgi:multidrug efflux pump subunit AcrA (membrane-fusion protein)/DNA-directed RNA polymerase subunit RPC12/RpoP
MEETSNSIAYPCHHCGIELDLTPEFYGMKVECPGCGGKFIVEEPGAGDAEESAQQAASQEAAARAAAQEVADREAAAQQAAAQEVEAQQTALKEKAAQQAAAKDALDKEAAQRRAARAAASALEPVVDEIQTDVMMRDFKGKKVVMLVLAAIAVHAVLIIGSSFGYLYNEVFGEDTSELSKEDRVNIAVGEATSALSDIAERHTLSMNDILEKFAAIDSKEPSAGAVERAQESLSTSVESTATDTSSEIKPVEIETTEFERNLLQAKPGPEIPISDGVDTSGL